MNAILSIKPEFVKEIVSGRKRYEYRKAIFRQPVEKVYIYASAPVGRVVGELEPVKILIGEPTEIWEKTKAYSDITKEFYKEYFCGRSVAYAIEIKNLVIFDEPKVLPFHAPQSYRSVTKTADFR